MENDKLRGLIAFCVLMQNNEGILGKSPDYVIEKWHRYTSEDAIQGAWAQGIDFENGRIMQLYFDRWSIN